MTTDHNEAMRLAGELVAPIGTQTSYQTAHEAAALLRKQAERIAELETENGAFREGFARDISEKTMLTDLAVRHGGLFAQIEGGAAGVLARAFAEQFTEAGGVNYVEVSFSHPKTGPMSVTLQRTHGKTPHQLRAAAEAERDTLRAEVERLKREKAHAIDKAGHMLAAGMGLSNCAFNLKQRVGEPLSTHDVAALDSAQRAWDTAIDTARKATQ